MTEKLVTVCRVGEIPLGTGKSFPMGDRIVAVFHDEDGFHAINDFCPHMGASLADGHLENGQVTCPWHAWRFRVSDGTWCDNPTVKTDSYEVRVEGDQVQIRLPDSDSSAGGTEEET